MEVSTRLIYRRGEPVAVQGIARDISERRRSEVQKARLAALVETSPDAIIIQTLAGTITDWNEGAARAYGYSAEEAVGQHISLIMPDGSDSETADHSE